MGTPALTARSNTTVLTDGPRISQPWTLERGISPTNGARGVAGPAATDAWALYTTVCAAAFFSISAIGFLLAAVVTPER